MKITKLIKKLETVLKDHGDLDVVVVDETSGKRVGIREAGKRLDSNGKLFMEITSDT